MILIIDNYDSFTWNLVHRLAEADPSLDLDRDIVVRRNDRISPDEADALDVGRGPSHLIISPGPCTPREAGNSGALIEHFAGRVPILGVCLGHQCIAERHGMTVRPHPLPVHGRTSLVEHDGRGLFAGVPSPLVAARYHSLIVEPASFGLSLVTGPGAECPGVERGRAAPGAPIDGWEISAWTHDQLPGGRTQPVIMGLRRLWRDPHRAPLNGVQFHPESFMTDLGPRLLANFLRARSARVPPVHADVAPAARVR
ncbi:MAG: aminodeoxychorismate/anthranilate synthase component II [Phycisphaerales bacterium]|nr:aminodeoxychorismate/anthranilate synthase component II [Phycisphaerales bacterium]